MSSGDEGLRGRRRWRPNPDTALAVAAIALAAGGGGYALGAGTGEQVITACFDPASPGTPQKIIAGTACDPGQTTLSWNQVGPQGQVGSAGVQGPAGPAGKDALSSASQTVVALPPKPSLRRKGSFTVRLELPQPGTYEIDGHVQWSRSKLKTDAPVVCRLTRTQPAGAIDVLNTTILKDDLFNVGAIDETGLTTVSASSGSDTSGTVIAVPVPVTVSFGCTAQRSATVTNANPAVLFRDWTLSATPVKVSVVAKPK